jgi:Carboxypeptidase regulatory-like domain
MRLGGLSQMLPVLLLLTGGTSQRVSVLPLSVAMQSTGILAGTLTKGPLSPVERPGTPPSSGVAGAQIDIATNGGKLLTSVETDSSGTFSVNLPVGTYKVTMPSLCGAMFTKDLPATVTIAAGRQTRLDIHLDTGIR